MARKVQEPGSSSPNANSSGTHLNMIKGTWSPRCSLLFSIKRTRGFAHPACLITFIFALFFYISAFLDLSAFGDVLTAEAGVCANCSHPVTGKYLKIDGRVFHPECFVCKKCRKPITGRYSMDQGAYFHAACYVQAKNLMCSYCGKPLDTQYVVLNHKKYHTRCAKKQIASQRPACSICGKPIEKTFVSDKNGKYHPTCYRSRKLPRCNVCAAPIEGNYIKDPWGNIAHKKCRGQSVHFCNSCNRIISGRTSKGGYSYPDGRIICGYCKGTAVESPKAVQQSLKKILKQFDVIGLSPIPVDIPIQLVNSRFMQKTQNSANPKGLTRCKSEYINARPVSKKQTVHILYGLPKTEFEGVLAHELIHVWLNLNSVKMSDRNTEGFCNLGAMLIYEHDNSPFSRVLLDNMEKDPDSAYGKGYRRMKTKLHKLGWPTLIQNVKAGKP